jgi:hypothetical protein
LAFNRFLNKIVRKKGEIKLTESEKRFEVKRVSRSTGFSNHDEFETIEKAKFVYNESINDPSYAVQIWDKKKSDFVLYQFA